MGPDLECVLYSPLLIVLLSSHNFSLIPIYAVVIFVDMDPNTTVVVISSGGGKEEEGGRKEGRERQWWREKGGGRREKGRNLLVQVVLSLSVA